MAIERRIYEPTEFVSLSGGLNPGLLTTQLGELTLTVPPSSVVTTIDGGLVLEWTGGSPTDADNAALDAFVAAYVGGSLSSAPFELNSFEVATSTSTTPVVKIEHTTPQLDPGTYQVVWASSIRMQAVAAGTGVEARIRLERSDGAVVEQSDAWDLNVNHAYNGAITFQIDAGQTIHARLSFSRLGSSGTAEMSGARVTIDQLSAA